MTEVLLPTGGWARESTQVTSSLGFLGFELGTWAALEPCIEKASGLNGSLPVYAVKVCLPSMNILLISSKRTKSCSFSVCRNSVLEQV